MEDEKVKLSKEEAISLLSDSESIHTFRNNRIGMLIGADWDRTKLVESFEKYEDTLELAGEQAMAMKHGIVLKDEHGYLFVETDDERLKNFSKD